MNSLVMLLVATAATGADPQPVVQQTVTPVASSTYTEAAPENRPGLIGRIRNAFSPKPSSPPVGTFSDSSYPLSGSRTWGAAGPITPAVIPPEAMAAPTPRFVPSGSSPEPPLADPTPVTTAAPPVEPRPAIPQAAVPVPSYTYAAPDASGPAESNRPRFFSRIRKLFGNSSNQPSQALPVGPMSNP